MSEPNLWRSRMKSRRNILCATRAFTHHAIALGTLAVACCTQLHASSSGTPSWGGPPSRNCTGHARRGVLHAIARIVIGYASVGATHDDHRHLAYRPGGLRNRAD